MVNFTKRIDWFTVYIWDVALWLVSIIQSIFQVHRDILQAYYVHTCIMLYRNLYGMKTTRSNGLLSPMISLLSLMAKLAMSSYPTPNLQEQGQCSKDVRLSSLTWNDFATHPYAMLLEWRLLPSECLCVRVINGRDDSICLHYTKRVYLLVSNFIYGNVWERKQVDLHAIKIEFMRS